MKNIKKDNGHHVVEIKKGDFFTIDNLKNSNGVSIKNIILGGQDGLVNVLGLVLGVAGGTGDVRIVIIAGLAGTFAESISMGAVAYTSSKAARDYYLSELHREKREIEEVPQIERQEIVDIYRKKGFSGKLLEKIVDKITSSKKLWLETMMADELRLFPDEYMNPGADAFVVGISSLIGSLIPIMPFFFVTNSTTGIITALAISSIALFTTGALKAKYTVGDWKKAGVELMAIGITSALVGYFIGKMLGITI